MLYNRCTGIYKFGNNTYPRRIRRRSNLGHIFQGKKLRLMGREIWQFIFVTQHLLINVAVSRFSIRRSCFFFIRLIFEVFLI